MFELTGALIEEKKRRKTFTGDIPPDITLDIVISFVRVACKWRGGMSLFPIGIPLNWPDLEQRSGTREEVRIEKNDQGCGSSGSYDTKAQTEGLLCQVAPMRPLIVPQLVLLPNTSFPLCF